MLVRFGYVAIALGIAEGSPNKTVTVKSLEKLTDNDVRLNRLRRLTRVNLETTLRILRYNVAHKIHLYRFTSKIVPLPTHPISTGFDYIGDFKKEWNDIGDYIKKHNIRISTHPDHYTLLNSPKHDVIEASIKDLKYHSSIFEAMGLECQPQLVIHIGGLYKNKDSSLNKFCEEYQKLPNSLRLRIMLENDDKSYTAADVLDVCTTLKCPMVFDVHHHTCINNGENLSHLWNNVIKTWKNQTPKIHLSSPKSDKDFRSHADFVTVSDFLTFLYAAKELNKDFDVMIEAKQKDLALFKLMDDLEKIPGIKRIEQASIVF